MSGYSYKNKSYKLSDELVERLRIMKEESGKSWNLFFRDLANEYENKNK